MSTEKNKAVFHRIIEEGLNKRDTKVFDELIAADYVGHNLPPGWPSGREGFKKFVAYFWSAFPDVRFMFEDDVAEGDKVAGRGYFAGTHKGEFQGIPPTGKQINVKFMDVWRFENGKFVEYWGQADFLGMMQQLGVVPTPGQSRS